MKSKIKYEGYTNKENLEKIRSLEQRMFKVQSELSENRLARTTLEKRTRQMSAELHELIEKMKNL